MREMVLNFPPQPFHGELHVPGDKSISHRAIMMAALANGTSEITNFLQSEDCLHTITAFQTMGVTIHNEHATVIVEGKGLSGIHEPLEPIYFGNSGTTARLMLGILAGLPNFSTVYGDHSLSKRPMDRVVHPLREMGAIIVGREDAHHLPIAIQGKQLQGITYELPVKSAQVKSAILFAGLLALGETTVIEKTQTRNHTENMLQAFGAHIITKHNAITISSENKLKATNVHVPGDISSAAFFLVGACLIPGSKLTLKNVGLNQSRTGIIDVLKKMGAKLSIVNKKVTGGEPFGDLTIEHSHLSSIVIEGDIVPRLIDEIPIIALLATQAEGTTVIRDAEELKVKETDRINAVVDVLSTLGTNIEATDDGMIIHGKTTLSGGKVSSYYDHRIAMMIVIASFLTKEEIVIDDVSCIDISYPNFFEHIHSMR